MPRGAIAAKALPAFRQPGNESKGARARRRTRALTRCHRQCGHGASERGKIAEALAPEDTEPVLSGHATPGLDSSICTMGQWKCLPQQDYL